EHTLSIPAALGLLLLALMLLVAYGFHGARREFPLLRLRLFRVRTFRAAVVGGFITRLGAGGMPFMLPPLYQVGLGYSPVQSGLLIMPQPLTAIALRLFTPRILTTFDYKNILLTNTVCMSALIILFMTVTPGTPP